MKKKLSSVLALVLAMSTVLVWTVPVSASVGPEDFIPANANTNALRVSITAPNIVYHDGELIHYVVTISVPADMAEGPDFHPAFQTNISGNFTNPAGVVTNLPPVPNLMPGQYVAFTSDNLSALNYTISHSDEDSLHRVTAKADIKGIGHVSVNNNTSSGHTEITRDVSHPKISVTKAANPTTSKTGDNVTYTIAVANSGDISLNRVSVVDSLLGDIHSSFPTTLGIGASSGPVTFNRTILVTDPDPLVNTVTATYSDSSGKAASANASASVDLVHPIIGITKTVIPTISKVGDNVTYTIRVTNTSADVTLVNIVVTDPLLGAGPLPGFASSLAPGASSNRTFAYTIKSSDPDPVVNTATVHANPTGMTNDITASATASVDLVHPIIGITKTVIPTISKIGDNVTYTIKVTNTSADVTLVNVVVTDPLLGAGPLAGFASSLAPGANSTQTFAYTIKSSDPDPVVNTAAVHANPTGLTNDITASASASVDLVHPIVGITKTVIPTISKVGDNVTYTIKVTNTSADVTLVNVVVTDPLLSAGPLSGFASSLAPGASSNQTFAYTIKSTDPDPVVNTAAVHANPTGLTNDITASASASVDLVHPIIGITKTVIPTISKIGDNVTYTIMVTNTSADVTLVNVVVTDPLLSAGPLSGFASSLAPGASSNQTFAYTIKSTDPDPVVNTATVHANPTGLTNDITASASASVDLVHPIIGITKTVIPTISKIGDNVTYTIKVTNTSADVTLVNVVVTDPLLSAGPLSGFASSMAPGASSNQTFAYTIKSTDPDPVVNTATVHANPTGLTNDITASASASVDLVHPIIGITKTVIPTISKIGDNVTYTIKVTNTSADVTLVNVVVTDPLLSAGPLSGFASSLAPGASSNQTFAYTIKSTDPDPVVNTATVHANPTGLTNDITASASASVDLVHPIIGITKTVIPTISKIGDNVTYTIKVTNTSADVTLVNVVVTDPLLSAGPLSGFDTSLAPGASSNQTFAYTIKSSDPDPVVNTATVHANPTGLTNDITASASASVDLVHPIIGITKTVIPTISKIGDNVTYTIRVTNTSADVTLVNVVVTDPLLGAGPLAGFASSLAPGASSNQTFAYTIKSTDPDPVVNTATVHANPTGLTNDITASASASVDLVHPTVGITKTAHTEFRTPEGAETVPPISKVGDNVTYTIMVTNTSADVTLVNVVVTDPLLGAGPLAGFASSLAPGASSNQTFAYTIKSTDPDPLMNTATVHANPTGMTNDITASASASVDLVHPIIGITKTVIPTISKVGDNVTYTIRVTNTSADVTLVNVVVTDPMLGEGALPGFASSLAPGASSNQTFAYTIKSSDPDPLVNTAAVHANPTGLTNDITASASASVDLVHPIVGITKTVIPTISKIGDNVTYTIRVTNTSADVTLVNVVVTDPMLGEGALPGFANSLAPGASSNQTFAYKIKSSDPDPVVNTAAVHANPTGLTNDITASASASVDLVHPTVGITKNAHTEFRTPEGAETVPPISKVGDNVTYTIMVTNTSADVTLVNIVVTDPLLGAGPLPGFDTSLAPGASSNQTFAYTIKSSDPDPVVNTATVHANPTGLTNDITASASASVDLVHPTIAITKTVIPTISKVGDNVTYTIMVTNTSADVTLVNIIVTDPLLGAGALTGFANSLASGASSNQTFVYTVKSSDADPLVNTATVHANPIGMTNDIMAGASAVVDLIHPNTIVTIASSASQVLPGGAVTLTVTEANTGDWPLISPQVVLVGVPGTLNLTLIKASPGFVGGDTGNDGVLGVGETWRWMVSSTAVSVNTTYTATGDGIAAPLDNHITYPVYPTEQAHVTVTVINPNTTVTITASAPTILTGGNVTLTVTEHNTGDVPLTDPNVVLSAPLSTTLTKASSSFAGGDTGDDGILGVGETWTWSLNSGALPSTTIITATGHGIDPLGNDVIFPCYPNERAQVAVVVISPITMVTIVPQPFTVYAGGNITLAIVEQNPGSVPLTGPRVNVSPIVGDLTAPPTGGDANGNSILDVGETWWWLVPNVSVNTTTTFTAIGHGTDPLGNDVTYPAYQNERAQVTVTAISPSTTVNITSSAASVVIGGNVTLTVTEQNTGNVSLTSPKVNVSPTVGDLVAPPSGGDINGNGVLDVGETWTWTVPNVTVNASTTFYAIGHGIDPLNNDVTFPAYQNEKAQVAVSVVSGTINTAITSPTSQVVWGGNVTLTVTEANASDHLFTNPFVTLVGVPGPLNVTLIKTTPGFTSGDSNDNGVLDVGETWSWSLSSGALTATTTFTATGHGTDPMSNNVTSVASTLINVYILGDADGSGTVNMGDVVKVERIILTLESPVPAADANSDGLINIGDVTKIERIVLGLP